jgi:hypothetical protein
MNAAVLARVVFVAIVTGAALLPGVSVDQAEAFVSNPEVGHTSCGTTVPYKFINSYGYTFTSNDKSQYIYQTVDYTILEAGDYGPNLTDKIDARVNHKLDSSSHGGDVRLEILIRQIDYDSGCNAHIANLDLNTRDLVTPAWTIIETTGWVDVGTSWSWDTTPTHTFPSSWEGAEVRVRLKSTVKTSGGSGSYTWVHVDTMRGRER